MHTDSSLKLASLEAAVEQLTKETRLQSGPAIDGRLLYTPVINRGSDPALMYRISHDGDSLIVQLDGFLPVSVEPPSWNIDMVTSAILELMGRVTTGSNRMMLNNLTGLSLS